MFYNYNYSLSYVLNLIKINTARKDLIFDLIFTKKTFIFVKILKKLGYIHKYSITKKKNSLYIKIYIYFFKNKRINTYFKLVSKPSKSFFISLKSLRLLSKRTGGSVFLISTSYGLITHREALDKKTGGIIVGFFSL